ncbi:hypothetical protein C8R42DRAFT_648687 [Lentinula raphanica]|nr:hypothetical protein C8R42DRAFT_648687 [Lentinula raphanica]
MSPWLSAQSKALRLLAPPPPSPQFKTQPPSNAPYGEGGSLLEGQGSTRTFSANCRLPSSSSISPGTTFAASLSSTSYISLISSSPLSAVYLQAMIMVYDILSIRSHAFRDVKLVYHFKGHPCILIESWYHILNPLYRSSAGRNQRSSCPRQTSNLSLNRSTTALNLSTSSGISLNVLYPGKLQLQIPAVTMLSQIIQERHFCSLVKHRRDCHFRWDVGFVEGSCATVVEFVFAGDGNPSHDFMLGSLFASSLGSLNLRDLKSLPIADAGIVFGAMFNERVRERIGSRSFGYVKYNSHITQPTLQGVVRSWPMEGQIRRMLSGIMDIDNALNENATSQRRYRSRKTRIGFRERRGSDGDVDDDSGYLESSLASRKWYPESSEYIKKHEWNRRKWFIGGPLGLCSASMLQDDLVMKVAQNVLQTRLEGERGGIPVATAKRPSTSLNEVVLQISSAWLETHIVLRLPPRWSFILPLPSGGTRVRTWLGRSLVAGEILTARDPRRWLRWQWIYGDLCF